MNQRQNSRTNSGFQNKFWLEHPPPDYGQQMDLQDKEDEKSRESLDSTGKTKSFKRLVVRFAEKTSMQGVAYINSAKVWYAKIIWTFLLIGCTAGMGLHLYYLINQFLLFPVQTKIELGFSNLIFPAVTICNVNPIRMSKIDMASQQIQSLIEQLEWSNLQDDEETTTQGARRRKRFVDELSKINRSAFSDYDDNFDNYDDDDYEFGSQKDERLEILSLFRELYKDEERDTKVEMGHHIEDMLISCTVGKYKCYASNFTVLQHDVYGNCYTLKTGSLKIAKAGPTNGLSLILYMDKEEYLKQISEGYGARVLVHDKDTYPYPLEEGFFVPSSSETQIGLRMVTIERQDKPYGNCTEDTYIRKYGYKYTRSFCQTLCSQELFFKTCGCYEDDVTELYYQIKTGVTEKFCETRQEIKCMNKERARQNRQKAECDCKNPCREHQFLKTISYRNWPTEDYMFTLKDGVCDRLPAQCKDASALYGQTELYRKSLNYVKIDIYYEDLNFERIVESPEIENAQFASDVGGAVGLWIGLSFLSMFEVVQLLLECCAFAGHKCTNRSRKRNARRRKNKSIKTKENIYATEMDNKKSNFSKKESENNLQLNKRYQDLYAGNFHEYNYIDNRV
ncbi:FMRFamide-activated amiloride-sensitive sodium channel-like [Mytilus edulis]|uniref:FMRFamide-activated amiloride-sensitive sodium channel-like n=1 Tax=Mytilus edulis TaxID=6550 RepID=UPI0039EFA6DF